MSMPVTFPKPDLPLVWVMSMPVIYPDPDLPPEMAILEAIYRLGYIMGYVHIEYIPQTTPPLCMIFPGFRERAC